MSWPGWYIPVAVVLGVLSAALFAVYWVFDALADSAEASRPKGRH
ncbi:MAG: hypothetical protein ACREPI_10005 [Candidatus Dormibacterales bacterium]